MKRVACNFVIFFIIGILIGYYLNSFEYLVFSVVSAEVLLFLIYRKRKDYSIFLLPIFIIFGFVGIVNSLAYDNYSIEKVASDEREVEIYATIYKNLKEYDNGYGFLAKTESIIFDDKEVTDKVNIKVTSSYNDDEKCFVGDKVFMRGKIMLFDAEKNPDSFNAKEYYKTRNIEYRFYSTEIKKVGEVFNLTTLLAKLNEKVCLVYDEIFPQVEASFMKAMIAGDKTDLSAYNRDLFSKAGVYHIIAISGIHIHILAFIILFICEKIHKRYGKLIAILFVILYCLFTGASPSAMRATIMFLVYIIGKFIYRESDTLNTLGISALIILVFQPLYLFDVGFQYSFGAVLSIVIFSKPVLAVLERFINFKGLDMIATAISVNFIPKLIMMNYFYGVATLDLLANIIIIPLAGIVIFLGFVIGIVGLFSIGIASFFSGIPYIILVFYQFVCKIIYEIPFSYIQTGKPSFLFLMLYIAVIFIIGLYFYNKINKKIFKISLCYAVGFYVATSVVFCVFKKDEFKITMLDVGQGDCFVFEHKDKCFIIDGGGNFEKELGNDTGVNVLLPYLRYRGITKVDKVFVTHTDVDHAKGIVEIMDYVGVDELYLSDVENTTEYYSLLTEKAELNSAKLVKIADENDVKIDDDIMINCFYPKRNESVTGNETSLVLKISFKNNSFLFTGDIDTNSEDNIIKNHNGSLKADILKLAHHGSKYSNSEQFIDEVSPKLAIVSAGNFNRYGHPAKEVIKRLNDKGVNVINTREKGAMEMYSDGDNIYFETMKWGCLIWKNQMTI